MTHRFFASLSRRAAAVLGGTVLASALLGASAAQAQDLRGLSNADGTIQCEYGDVGGTYIRCHSPGARATRTECNPPNYLVPRVQYSNGKSWANCFNQGLSVTNFKKLRPGEVFQFNELAVIADLQGGLHLVSPSGYAGYVGKTAIDDASGMSKVSSRAV